MRKIEVKDQLEQLRKEKAELAKKNKELVQAFQRANSEQKIRWIEINSAIRTLEALEQPKKNSKAA